MRSHAKAPHGQRHHARRAVASAFLLSLLLLAMTSASASAVVGHSLLRTFSTGPGSGPGSVATDSAGNVYVLNRVAQRIDKFDSAGNRIPFSGSAPYIADSSLTGTPAGPFEIYPEPTSGIAVDRSGGPNDGYIYFARTDSSNYGDLLVFDPTGTYKGRLSPRTSSATGIAVNQATGELNVADGGAEVIRRYPAPTGNPAFLVSSGQLHVQDRGRLAADSSGAIYTDLRIKKYDASQFGLPSPTPAAEYEPIVPAGLAVDPANNDLYIDNGSQLIRRNAAGALQGAPFGNLSGSGGVTTDVNGNVLASDGNGGVFVYSPNQVELALATTGSSSSVTTQSAEVEGSADPDGAGNITGCEFRYGPDSGYSEGSVPCTPGGPISSTAAVSANLTGLVSGTTYHYRLFLTNVNGTQVGDDQTFATPPAIEGVSTAPATEVKKASADLNGSFTGDGQDTHYYFEWGKSTIYGHAAPAPPGNDAGTGSGTQNVAPVQISGLEAGTVYHFRLVASNANGIARSQDETFTTPSAVTNLSADPAAGITNHGAELNASFDADSYEVHYYFEWGPTTNYGHTTPVPPGNAVAPGGGRISVPPVPIAGLQEGATYHYRVVASNATGTSFSPDAVFETAEAPSLSNLNSRNVAAESAELTAEVNPNLAHTTYKFEWGTTTAYGNASPVPDGDAGSGNSAVSVSTQLEGLPAGLTYHFRLVATNPYGTVSSSDQTFSFYPPSCPNAQLRQETRSNSLPDCRAYELVTPSFAQGTFIFPQYGPAAPLATSPSRLAYTGAYE